MDQVLTESDPDGTITISATGSSYTKWVLGDTGTDQDINDGNTATFAVLMVLPQKVKTPILLK